MTRLAVSLSRLTDQLSERYRFSPDALSDGVLSARDADGDLVRVRIIPLDGRDPAALGQTVRIAASLDDGVADLREFGTTDDCAFVVTAGVGAPLSDVLVALGALPARRLPGLIRQVATTLERAEALDLGHGDLSADTVCVSRGPEGLERFCLLDLGLMPQQGSAVDLRALGRLIVAAVAPDDPAGEHVLGLAGWLAQAGSPAGPSGWAEVTRLLAERGLPGAAASGAVRSLLDELGATMDAMTLAPRDLSGADDPLAGLSEPSIGAAELAAGSDVGVFRVKRLIGEGGMGLVYLARDTTLGRPVALKVIRPEHLGRQRIDRFMHEARTTARFNHPNIVTVYAVGERDGVPWVALEYLEGDTLRERMDDDKVGVREAGRLLLPVARALEEAHKHGVLHRDLKPSNIVIPRDGRVRVVDFGLAKTVRETELEGGYSHVDHGLDDSISRVGALVGTPHYMSPEQLTRGEVSTAADMWALGVLLFEMLVGERPFHAAEVSLSVLRAAVSEEATPPLPAELAIPGELEGLIQACLSKKAVDRPTASDAVGVLEHSLSRQGARSGDVECPFRGLEAFSERHAGLFFGRDGELAGFMERIRTESVLPIVGPSGAGTSSFVMAGVVPRLRERNRWTVVRVRPGATPFRTLARRLLFGRGSTTRDGSLSSASGSSFVAEATQDVTEIATQLASAPGVLGLMLLDLAERTSTRVLLYVDQLEELHTLVPDASVRAAFTRSICLAADDPDDPVRVVFTLRDDFLGRFADGPEARHTLNRVTVLRAPEAEDLRSIVLRPLEATGHALDDPAIADEMVEAVQGEAAGLPLLQFAARMLWERRDPERQLLLRSAYQRIGGVEGALATHAEGTLDSMTGPQIDAARELLLRLVTDDRTRRSVSREAVVEGIGPEAEEVLSRLIDARLLSVRRSGPARTPSVELAHESLVTSWRRLARWLEDSRDDHLFLSELEQASELWQRHGMRDGELWEGEALAEAHRKLERTARAVPGLSRTFVERALARQQRRTRLRRRLYGSAVLLLAIAAAVGIFLANSFAAKEAETRRQKTVVENQAESMRIAAADLGRFVLHVRPIDWDPVTGETRAADPRTLSLSFTLHRASQTDPLALGAQMSEASVTATQHEGTSAEETVWDVEAPAGRAFLRVDGRGRPGSICAPSVLRLLR
ncbi:MAG: hypothetical protein ACI9WU_003591, partial [Myxococcota bacterium]